MLVIVNRNAVGMHGCIIMVLMWISPTMLDIVSVSIFPIYFEFGRKICLFPCTWFWQSFICAGYAIVKMSSPSTLYFLVLRRHHLKRKKSFWWSSFTIFSFMSHMSCAISRIFPYPSPRKSFSSILFQIWVKVFVYYWWSCIIILTSFVENINLVLLYFCHKAIDYTHTCVYIWICYSVSLVHLLSLFQHPHYLHECSFNKSSSYKVLFI